MSDIFNVKDQPYGAAGTGSVDDASAIQQAIDAAGAVGGRVYFPPGTYRIDTPLVKANTYRSLRMEGASMESVTIRVNDSATGFSSASHNMVETQSPQSILTNNGTNTAAIPVGSDAVPVSSTANISVGDLLLVRPVDTATYGMGEIRRVRAIGTGMVYADAPYLLPFAASAIPLYVEVIAEHFVSISDMTLDTANYAAGHGAIYCYKQSEVRVSRVRMTGGGQHGVYSFLCHTAIYDDVRAEDFSKRLNAWTPEKAGESTIAASRSELAGEGYGVAFNSYIGVARNCRFRRCRHAVSAGGTTHFAGMVLYDNCVSVGDLQGAFDVHASVVQGEIRSCKAYGGWAGGWVRGSGVTVRDCVFADESDGVRLHEKVDQPKVLNSRFARCLNGIRLIPDAGATVSGMLVQGNDFVDCGTGTANGTTLHGGAVYCAAAANVAALSVQNVRILDNLFRGGRPGVVIDGYADGVEVSRNQWRGPTVADATSESSLVWIRAAAGTAQAPTTVRGVAVRDNTAAMGASPVVYVVSLDRPLGGTSLADDTYRDVRVTHNDVTTTGTSYGIVSVAYGAKVAGIDVRTQNSRNGAIADTAVVAFRQVAEGWYRAGVSANTTPVAMTRSIDVVNGEAWRAPRAGSVTALYLDTSALVTAGQLNAEVYRGSTALGNAASFTSATGSRHLVKTFAPGTLAFSAGDLVSIKVDANGSFAPANTGVAASIEVELL